MVLPYAAAPYFIDQYESSLWSAASCEGTQYGLSTSTDDYPAGFPELVSSTGCGPGIESCTGGGYNLTAPSAAVYACSRGGVKPSGLLTWFRARLACEFSGKRLCTASEWGDGCGTDSYPYGSAYVAGTCADQSDYTGPLSVAGGHGACHGTGELAEVYDMSGNASEWTDDCNGGQCNSRGGESPQTSTYLTCGNRWSRPASGWTFLSGVRCCVDAP